ncbi:hypothetical protein BC826DRAFT_62160 [Russula brevipes]|nr:hypothetical protein BC826DRAFT_62160 [Russula brevipes]
MAHYDTFREQLAINYPASGHALWEPSPRSGKDRVEVGDVGFIREGKFYRLFNALLSADHPSHRRFGVPEYHEVLVPSLSDHIDTSILSRNHYCSAGITMETEPDFRASNPDGFPEVSFTCTRRRGGAVLSIPVQAQRQDTLVRRDFGKWMLKHIDRWFAFTQRLGLGIEQMDEIVLVTGCDCARSWTNVAFLEGQGDAKASFGVKVVDGIDASINWQYSPEHICGALLNQDPRGRIYPKINAYLSEGFVSLAYSSSCRSSLRRRVALQIQTTTIATMIRILPQNSYRYPFLSCPEIPFTYCWTMSQSVRLSAIWPLFMMMTWQGSMVFGIALHWKACDRMWSWDVSESPTWRFNGFYVTFRPDKWV